MNFDEEEIGGGFDIIGEEEVGSLTAESNKPTPKSKGRKGGMKSEQRAAVLLQDGVLPDSEASKAAATKRERERSSGDTRKSEQKEGSSAATTRSSLVAMQDAWRELDWRSQEISVCLVRTGDSVSVTLIAAPSTLFPGEEPVLPVERSKEKVRSGVGVALGGTLGALFGGAPGSAIGAALGGYLAQNSEKASKKADKTQKLLQSEELVEEASNPDDEQREHNAKRLRTSSERSPVYLARRDEDDDDDEAAFRLYPVRAKQGTARRFEPPEKLPPPPQPD